MLLIDTSKVYFYLAIFEHGFVAKFFFPGSRLCAKVVKFRVVLFELAEKFIHSHIAAAVRRHEVLNFYIAEIELESCLPGKDEDLAGNVRAAEIVARVRLSVTLRFSFFHDIAEFPSCGEGTEDIIQSTAQYTFNADHFVSANEQIVQGVDHRQPGSDIGFVEEFYSPFECDRLEFAVLLIGS